LGSLFLLWRGRIYLDRETKQVVEIELPLGIKVKSSIPVLALILIGGGLVMYSASEASKIGEEVTVTGDLTGSTSEIKLYASVQSLGLPRGDKFSLRVPMPYPNRDYMLLYIVNGSLLGYQFFDPSSSDRVLPPLQFTLREERKLVGEIQPEPEGY
jgi:hypothetical protein